MSRDWRLYRDDMREACGKVVRYIGDMDKEAFIADEKTYDAVLRNLEVIGEASKQCHLRYGRGVPRSTGGKSPDYGM